MDPADPSQQRMLLFIVFLAFFVAIGVSSLAVLLGWIRQPDPGFKKWARGTFVVSVCASIFSLFRLSFLVPAPLYVSLVAPAGQAPPGPDLKSGAVEYEEPGRDGLVKRSLPIEVFLGGGDSWEMILPPKVANKVVSLRLQDAAGQWWAVQPFATNRIKRPLVPGSPPPPVHARLGPGLISVAGADPLTAQVPAAAAQQARLRFDNYAMKSRVAGGHQFYEWRVFVDAPSVVLDTIASVQYSLEPSFAQAFRETRDAGNQFDTRGSAWREFQVQATVRYKDGRSETVPLWVRLEKKSWPLVKAEGTTSVNARCRGLTGPAKVKVGAEAPYPDRFEFQFDCTPAPSGGSILQLVQFLTVSGGSAGWSFDVFVNDERKIRLAPARSDDPDAVGPAARVPNLKATVDAGNATIAIRVAGSRPR